MDNQICNTQVQVNIMEQSTINQNDALNS